MKYAYALSIVTVLVSSAFADECSAKCAMENNACRTKPGANQATCSAEYANCLGYNPYGGSGFVEPTACSKSSASATATSHPMMDACAKKCTEEADACRTKPDANQSFCSAEYADCLGYNPYEGSGFVEPTACKTGPVVTPTKTGGPEPPIVTAAADMVRPAIAMLALGAAALL